MHLTPISRYLLEHKDTRDSFHMVNVKQRGQLLLEKLRTKYILVHLLVRKLTNVLYRTRTLL